MAKVECFKCQKKFRKVEWWPLKLLTKDNWGHRFPMCRKCSKKLKRS